MEREGIAIVGMSGCFPGARDVEEFWSNIEAGVEARTEFSEQDLLDAGVRPTLFQRRSYVRSGFILDDVSHFDASFFGISPTEAELMDPQHRLFLEHSRTALEDAGYAPGSIDADVGVYAGASLSTYLLANLESDPRRFNAVKGLGVVLANDKDYLCTRVSYKLDLKGPSVGVQTACSSSLVAVAQACDGLLEYHCDMALAGGVSVRFPQRMGYLWEPDSYFSPDGRCRPFDARARGAVFGSGLGIVVLKRLEDAVADGDFIHAVIRGAAINNDGSRKVGFTAPSVEGQVKALALALQVAGVRAEEISYIEAHGTGTPLGDPIEMEALRAVFGSRGNGKTRRGGRCALGSVKSNIGHLEAAAGVVGLIKTVQALRHRTLPPSLNFETPNPDIDFENSPFYVNTQAREWVPTSGTSRLAGVSSFGMGGTNAHVILEEAPERPVPSASTQRPQQLLCLSAKTESALLELSERYRQALPSMEEASLEDLCFTASVGRQHFPYRRAVQGGSLAEFGSKLVESPVGSNNDALPSRASGSPPPVAFLFTGQGSQYPDMGRELFDQEPSFRRTLENCDGILREHLGRSILPLLYGEERDDPAFYETSCAQPLVFSLEYALAQLWISWGVVPGAVFGHSLGQYAAACIAGVLSLEDALRLVAVRGSLMESHGLPGGMAKVGTDAERVDAVLGARFPRVWVAAYNSPESVFLAGDREQLKEACVELESAGFESRVLHVTRAGHCPLMEPVVAAFRPHLADLSPGRPQIPWISDLDGSWIGTDAVADFSWTRHIVEPVRFVDGMENLLEKGFRHFVEIGPTPALLPLGYECQLRHTEASAQESLWLPSLRKGQGDWQQLTDSVGKLYVHGADLDWRSFHGETAGRRVPLPTYPYQRRSFWLDLSKARGRRSTNPQAEDHLLLGQRLESPLPEAQFESQLGVGDVDFLTDHRVRGLTLLPAAAYLEMALAAGSREFGSEELVLEDVRFERPFVAHEKNSRRLQLILAEGDSAGRDFRVFSSEVGSSEAGWVSHATGRLARAQSAPPPPVDPVELMSSLGETVEPSELYQRLARRGADYGPSLQIVRELRRNDHEAMARVELSEAGELLSFLFSPALLDACFHVLAVAGGPDSMGQGSSDATTEEIYLPTGCERFVLFAKPSRSVFSRARFRASRVAGEELPRADLSFFTPEGNWCGRVDGMSFRKLSLAEAPDARELPVAECLYEVQWQPTDPPDSLPRAHSRRWLIVGGEDGTAEQLIRQLTQGGQICTRVSAGDRFAEASGGYRLDPSSPEDFVQLMDSLRRADGKLHGIVLLWGLEVEPLDAEDGDGPARGLTRSCRGALHLIQSILSAGFERFPRLWFVTRGAMPVSVETDVPAAAAAPLLGLGKTVALEHPELSCRGIDLDPQGDLASQVAELCGEILEGPAEDTAQGEDQIAFRDGLRFVPRLARCLIANAEVSTLSLRRDAVYLVTGGFGGLGFLVASWLARNGAGQLILMGRQELDSGRREQVRHLETLGSKVSVFEGDVGDRQEVRRLLAEVEERGTPLRGIVHAAGVLQDGILLHQPWHTFPEVYGGKAEGAWNLHCETASADLDFFVMFSSTASLFGAPGQATHCAANSFLDALAHWRRARGLVASSIQWGAWSQVGGAVDFLAKEAPRARGIGALSPALGLGVLEKLLLDSPAVVAALPIDWSTLFRSQQPGEERPLLRELMEIAEELAGETFPTESGDSLRRQFEDLPSEEWEPVLVSFLQRQVASLLGWRDGELPPADQALNEIGLDSLMAIQLKERLRQELGVEGPMKHFVDGSNIQRISALLHHQLILAQVAFSGASVLEVSEDFEELAL